MEIGAMIKALEEEQECSDEESEEESEDEESLFFMEHNHDQLRAQEEPNAQSYWESGVTPETINALKQGNMDHSGKVCYHCSRKGHIKANCPARRKLEPKPWEHRKTSRERKGTGSRNFGARRERSKSQANQTSFAKRKRYGGAQAIHPEEDFGTGPAEN